MAREKLNYEQYPVGSDMYNALKYMSETQVAFVVNYTANGTDKEKRFEDKAAAAKFAAGKKYHGKRAGVATYHVGN